VRLQRGRRGGRLVIRFFSEEELQTIYERLLGKGE
ncbi:MAG: stage 0 sporulation protein J, partial [Chloroflexi bacterium]|nr:stage 0 sporulation protein J [Chloroflexota bacterium]